MVSRRRNSYCRSLRYIFIVRRLQRRRRLAPGGGGKALNRYDENPFYMYAAHHWGHHALESAATDPIPSVIDFLQDQAKVNASAQCHLSLLTPLEWYENGAPCDAATTSSWTGLHLAAMFGCGRYVHVLIDGGVYIDSVELVLLGTPLEWAIKKGHVSTVEALIARGANLRNDASQGRSPLIRAAETGQCRVIESLLDGGADVRSANGRGETALSVAIYYEHEAAVELLLAAGADPCQADEGGSTPLHIAAGRGV